MHFQPHKTGACNYMHIWVHEWQNACTILFRCGGWSRTGRLKYNDLYKQVKKDRLEYFGAYDGEYVAHWVEKCDNGGQLRSLTVSDNTGDLLGALDTKNNGAGGGYVAAV
jgi:hypothetical protein